MLQCSLLLLGRSDEPSNEPDWIAKLSAESEIKRAILDQSTEPLSPKELQSAFARVQSEREIRENLARIGATGVTVQYRSVDVRDAEAVRQAIEGLLPKTASDRAPQSPRS